MAWNQNLNDFADFDYVETVRISSLQRQLDELTSLVYQMVVGNAQRVETCGICAVIGHSSTMCPILREVAAGGFPGQPQMNYDPYSNTYNSGWEDHQNFSYGNPQAHQPYPKQADLFNSEPSLEDTFRAYMSQTQQLQIQQQMQQFEQETQTSIHNLENQLSQLATTVGRLDSQETIPISQEEADNINTEANYVDEDKNVLCVDDIPKVEEIVEQTNTDNLAVAITDSLEEEEEEIEQSQELKEVVTALHSVPVIPDKCAVFSISLPVTNKGSLSFILQDSIPYLKVLPDYIEYILLEEGVKPFYLPQGRLNLPMKDNVMDGVRKIHEVGVT